MNDLIHIFKFCLQEDKVSSVTIKNYVADLNKFFRWFSQESGKQFDPSYFSNEVIVSYTRSLDKFSARSRERYTSALKRFARFLIDKKLITVNPFDSIKKEQNASVKQDPWLLKGFRGFLYVNSAKRSTIRNYMVDINAFTSWVEKATITRNIQGISSITPDIINLYKERLISTLGLSPRTVNRKLSSIRRYFEFAKQISPDFAINARDEVLINPPSDSGPNIKLEDFAQVTQAPQEQTLSKIPPVRLAQRITSPYLAFEEKTAAKIADVIFKRRLEEKVNLNNQMSKPLMNIPKSVYAPEDISLSSFTMPQKILFYLKFKRPNWYKRYHNYPISTYLHLSILIIYASIVGYLLYNGLFNEKQDRVLAASSAGRVLSFQGRLTDTNDVPITKPTYVRFQIYRDEEATGAGALLWQELNLVLPDQDGKFGQLLGNGPFCAGQPLTPQSSACSIPSSLFAENGSLYLGVTIENTEELSPRKQIATVAFASNAETLQGMRPITSASEQTNVVLALDSSGNLTIGGQASPTFSATGGQFKLSGQPLLLSTNTASNADIVFEPDGIGKIDARKAIINTSSFGSLIPGAVEVNDSLVVLATESAQPAFVVNKDTAGGDIFVASSAGAARFIIENGGDLALQPGLSIDTLTPGSINIGNSKATTITIGRAGNGIILPEYSGQNGVLYGKFGTGEVSQATTSSLNLCLLSGGSSPSWGPCPGSGVVGSYLSLSGGLLHPTNTTSDFALGGNSTTSAKFGIFNLNGSGVATATLSGNFYVMPVKGAGGNLGIGTDKPQTRTHISSTADEGILRLEDSDGTCDHNPEAGSETVTCLSDERLKSNIEDAKDSLPQLLKYRIRSYSVNSSGDLQTGVIAQEVAEIFPEKVKTGSDGYLMVEQPSVWVIIKSLQEVYAKFEEISEKLASLSLNSVSAMDGSVTSAGESLRELIAGIVEETISQSGYVSPLVTAENISTNIISPLAEDSNISIDLTDSELKIRNSKDASRSAVVASIDNSGNASFNGTLTADSLQTTDASLSGNLTANAVDTRHLTVENATISGTLYASNVKADQIEGLDEKIAYATQTIAASSASGAIDINGLMTGRGEILLGEVLDLESVSADFATFREGLIALGPATFAQVTILDSFSIGTNFIFGANSINTLGQDLEIQPLKQGAVSILADAIRIETDGTLKVRGNTEIAGDVTVGGKVKTNILSPLPGRDLVVEASNSAVLSVNNAGDVTSSGSATFNKFNLSFVAPAYALSDTEVVATSAAGLASIKPYRTELTIYNPNVTDNSLIYITPVSRTYNQVLYLIRQTPEDRNSNLIDGSFTVGIDAPVSREVQFNWIIVN
jgi:site-specific recombinase XerD